MTTFYLHEDDWGMINLLPAENAVWAEDVAREAQRASEENFAGFTQVGGFQIPTYHNIYVIPEVKHPIAQRGIHLDGLRALFVGKWPEAERVVSGYSSHTEELSGCFAFGDPHDDFGAFYGSQQDGIVTGLHVIRPSVDDAQAIEQLGAALAQLGKQYSLILVDWWARKVLDLRKSEGIRVYLAGET